MYIVDTNPKVSWSDDAKLESDAKIVMSYEDMSFDIIVDRWMHNEEMVEKIVVDGKSVSGRFGEPLVHHAGLGPVARKLKATSVVPKKQMMLAQIKRSLAQAELD